MDLDCELGSVRSVECEAGVGEESAENAVPVLQRHVWPAEQALQVAECTGCQAGRA